MDPNSIFRDGVEPLSGFHEPERTHLGYTVRTDSRFTIHLSRPYRYVSLHLANKGIKGAMAVRIETEQVGEIMLEGGWLEYPIDLGSAVAGDISFSLRPNGAREPKKTRLGIEVRKVTAFNSAHRLHALSRQFQNTLLNRREYREGKVVLKSTPPGLRITLVSDCNIKPPCAYCEWDWAKSMETGLCARNEGVLTSLADFYLNAEAVVDCSYGEPLMHEGLTDVVDHVNQMGKLFSMTSNGVLLNDSRQDMLLGKNLIYYVSMDAASAKSYARFRTEKFQLVVRNLKRFCQQKKEHNDLPIVVVSFLLMRSNLKELPEFVRLMESVGVDGIKLRGLYMEGLGKDAPLDRDGGVFDYHHERLSNAEMTEAVTQVKEMTRKSALRVFDGLKVGKTSSGQSRPLCSEPWRTLYVLNRGVMHCCFAKTPIMKLADLPADSLHDALQELWNSEAYREVRRALANHEFPRLCRETPSCPIQQRARATERSDRSK